MTHHDLENQFDNLARVLIPREDIDRARRVEHAITGDGKPNLKGLRFIPVLDENGDEWRIRVNSSGTITATKVTP